MNDAKRYGVGLLVAAGKAISIAIRQLVFRNRRKQMMIKSKERHGKTVVETETALAMAGFGNELGELKNQTEKERFKAHFLDRLKSLHGKTLAASSDWERYSALASVVRDYISKDWIATKQHYAEKHSKQVYYFSIEFLLGRLLGSNLLNLGIKDICQEVLDELGINLAQIEAQEEDAGLGNGGLGRLAACYLDSMASEHIPGHGCGIRYRYGLFEQKIVNGYQQEYPDNWLKNGYPWEYRRPDEAVEVKFGGNIRIQSNGKTEYIHENYESIMAIPYDIPVVGYHNHIANTLRLWSAEAKLQNLVCSGFSRDDCQGTVDYTQTLQTISTILYPDDSTYEGKVLRLKQQYFMVSAGLQSIIRNYKAVNTDVGQLFNHIAIHINDTHPALAIPELMRILMDEERLGWTEAWDITTKTISYTNHTILPEAMEKWPVEMVKTLLPRIFMIINEINERYCRELWGKYPGEWEHIHHMAVIADEQVHMAHLAVVGSHCVNGVAKLHTQILKEQVLADFYHFSPVKFKNVTNGVTHRRWLMLSNPSLTALINDKIGSHWIEYPCDLEQLMRYANDAGLQQDIAKIKFQNKLNLTRHIKEKYGVNIDTNSIFDVHVKRIHAYKRQLMNVLHIMDLYNRLKDSPSLDITPRTFIFGGKAAAGYFEAKCTIKLIHALADVVNNDKTIRDKIKVVFMENYNVSLAELIIPAADVSEQIPTASREACGTGNMKLMMNGAVTIGTLDGANIEIRDIVGDENIFIFGLTAREVLDYYWHGGYNSWDLYNNDIRIKTVTEQLINGFFPQGREEFKVLYDSLLYHNDRYFMLKDFASYVEAQNLLESRYREHKVWSKMCIANIAHSGRFAADRVFTKYAMDIWGVRPDNPVRCDCSENEFMSFHHTGCTRSNQSGSIPLQ
ncbi:Glycogen phosphorylase [Sporomusa ovata DSM 2662]|uniref:Alpha-1,4 glucan phosphorylase n=2 Tax=Sporomusa ovata TaxID=2378 RepID=A0A0U1KXF6_9FIRM|nr:glycogen phosphorylase [Sporomusa ovata DSM 2662]CQR72111.1 Glycogen phosphorylase [Sporomusa ovata]